MNSLPLIRKAEGQPLERSILGASPECGVVDDIRNSVSPDIFAQLRALLQTSTDAETQRNAGIKGKKITVESILDEGQGFSVQVRGLVERIVIPKSPDTNSHLGGGMFNSLTDAGVITKHLGEHFNIPPEELPLTQFVFPAAEAIRESTLAKLEAAGVENLKIHPTEGETRSSIFLKDAANPKDEILLSTPTGRLGNEKLPTFSADNGFVVINNEKAGSKTFADIVSLFEDKKRIWAVGSNQIKEGLANYVFFLAHCETITLNLDEMLEWVRSHSDPNIYNDPILLETLEDLAPEEADKVNRKKKSLKDHSEKVEAALPDHRDSFTWNIQADRVPKEISEDPEKRFRTAQRCADLIHKLGFQKGTLYVTDGENQILVSHRKSAKEKVQSALPILPSERSSEVKVIIQKHGLNAAPDNSGAGDSFSGTVLALKQFTGNDIDPLVIGIIANYVSALIFHTPYSNLLEIEAKHPGLVKEVLEHVLSKLNRTHNRLKNETRRELLNENPHRESPIAHMIQE